MIEILDRVRYLLRRVRQSVIFYPVTTVYLTGVGVAVGVATKWFALDIGLLCLTVIAICVALTSIVREVQVVHHLVNSQRDELLNRITDLVVTLQNAGVDLPPRRAEGPNAQGTIADFPDSEGSGIDVPPHPMRRKTDRLPNQRQEGSKP